MIEEIVLIGDERVLAVPVGECGEPFVDLRTIHGSVRVDETRVRESGRSAYSCFARRGVAVRLARAAGLLPAGIVFMVKDAYRPVELQARYFAYWLGEYRTLYPELTDEELYRKTSAFVAPLESAPHPTGAAIDLTLATIDGDELDMGSDLDVDPAAEGNRTWLNCPDCTAVQQEHREILSDALVQAGFVNYPTEWWHWSWGDKYWGFITGNEAVYSAVDEQVVRSFGIAIPGTPP